MGKHENLFSLSNLPRYGKSLEKMRYFRYFFRRLPKKKNKSFYNIFNRRNAHKTNLCLIGGISSARDYPIRKHRARSSRVIEVPHDRCSCPYGKFPSGNARFQEPYRTYGSGKYPKSCRILTPGYEAVVRIRAGGPGILSR